MICSNKKAVVNTCIGKTDIDKLLKDLSIYIDWREGNHDEMTNPKEIGLVLKECYNIISYIQFELKYSKDSNISILNLKSRFK
jgi:hypothetical protein